MEIVELQAKSRETTGSNNARRLRASGMVPVNLYGRNAEPANLAVESREFERIMRGHAGANFIMKLKVDGSEDASVIIKEIQRHPIRDVLIHIDLLTVALDEKIVTGVPIRLSGTALGVREGGGVMQSGVREVQLEVLPTDLPEYIEVDVTELNVNQSLHAGELDLPKTVVLVGNPDDLIATILEPTKLVEPTVEEGVGAEEGEAGEAEEVAKADGEES